MELIEFFENLNGWVKWTGGTILFVLVLFCIFYFSGNGEVIGLPHQVNEIKQNATTQLVNESLVVVNQAGDEIIPAFHKVGEDMAKDVSDPATKGTIIGGMTLVGILIWAIIALAIIGAILTALGIKIKGINK